MTRSRRREACKVAFRGIVDDVWVECSERDDTATSWDVELSSCTYPDGAKLPSDLFSHPRSAPGLPGFTAGAPRNKFSLTSPASLQFFSPAGPSVLFLVSALQRANLRHRTTAAASAIDPALTSAQDGMCRKNEKKSFAKGNHPFIMS